MIRIVSRGSRLALWQTDAVASALRAADARLEVRVEVIRTTGDRIQDVPLAKIGDKGLFTKELDAAILDGRADLAVHSLKDVPTRIPVGLALAAVSVREDPRDVVLTPLGDRRGWAELPAGARVGTSSLRRRAQLRIVRPDLAAHDLRGNLDTRLARLDRGDFDAILLAAAGVLRLGWRDRIAHFLAPSEWLPAVGQGALAVVAREDQPELRRRLAVVHDAPTAACTSAERAFLRALEGGCQVPIAALATLHSGTLHLDGLVAGLDGSPPLRATERGSPDAAEVIGTCLADRLIQGGARALLAEVRAASAPQVAAAP